MEQIEQRKKARSGDIVSWIVDQSTICDKVNWAGKKPKLLEEELLDMQRKFQHFYVTLATSNRISNGNMFCPQCSGIITFDRGIRCISCGTTFNVPSRLQLGYIGQMPNWIGSLDAGGSLGQRGVKAYGHPYLKHIHRKIATMSETKKKKTLRYFLTLPEDHRTKVFFAPPIYAFYPSNWPNSGPQIYVERDYFDEILFAGTSYGHSSFHAYSDHGNKLLLLCIYASWHKVTMRVALEQRIVPKVMSDIMIADLIVEGKLDTVLRTLGTSIHTVYNWIGRSRHREHFKREFNKHVQIDA